MAVSRQTVYKWLGRAKAADMEPVPGDPGAALQDRSSQPHASPQRLPRARQSRILKHHRQRWRSRRIIQYFALPVSTVVSEHRRLGFRRLRPLEPPRPVMRYVHAQPGDLVHLAIKKLGRVGRVGHHVHGDHRRRQRGIGWEYVHVAIDDHSPLANAKLLTEETGPTMAAFMRRTMRLGPRPTESSCSGS
jgi:hypothetical protein